MHVLAITLSLIFLSAFWHLSRDKGSLLLVIFAHFIAVALATPTLWTALYNGYSQDSFFTLNMFGRFGVASISTVLIVIFYLLLFIKSQFLSKLFMKNNFLYVGVSLFDSLLSLSIFGLLYSLSPQIYYSFYQFLIPDLPNQIVIKSIFDLNEIVSFFFIYEEGSLSNHLSSLTLLTIMPFTLWVYYKQKTHLILSFLPLAFLSLWLPMAFY